MNTIQHNLDNYYGIKARLSRLPHVEGLWNIGGVNLPDFGVSEFLGLDRVGIPNNAAVYPKGQVFGTNTVNSSGQPGNTVTDLYNGSGQVYGPPTPKTFTQSGLSTGSVGSTNTQNSPGDSRLTQLQKVGGDMNPSQRAEYEKLLAEINGGQAETNRLIDEAYGASNNYLNQAEGALRADYPSILQEIEAQKAAGLRTAQSGLDSSLGAVKTNEESATIRNQNVMADARRMYDELRRGYMQRFGGASSAGQAATELGNLEQQRQAGRQAQDFTQTMKEIEGKRVEINRKFEDQKFQLDQVTNQAKNEANRDFQNKLLQIAQSRAENEQAKAQARLSALQDLRNKVYQIQLQNLQFQQTLQAQKQQAELGLQSYGQSISGLAGETGTIASGFNPTAQSNLQTGQTSGVNMLNQIYQGQISGKKPDEMDQMFPGLSF